MHYKAEDFEIDGALRDICIFDTSVRDWELLIAALSRSGWETRFRLTLPEGEAEVLEDVSELFDRLAVDGEISAAMSVRVGEVVFSSYFFDPERVEFTFDPRDVRGEASFGSLEKFMTWLGGVTGKRVVMTMESVDQRLLPPLLEYLPT